MILVCYWIRWFYKDLVHKNGGLILYQCVTSIKLVLDMGFELDVTWGGFFEPKVKIPVLSRKDI